MQRELVSYLVTQYKSLAIFSMSHEGLVLPGQMSTDPELGSPNNTRGCAYNLIVKLLWLSESNKAAYSDCLVRRTNTSFKDQVVGLSAFLCYSEHPRTIYVRGGS